MKWIKFIYKDGGTITQQWDELYDGEWPYGDLNEKIVYNDYNLFNE